MTLDQKIYQDVQKLPPSLQEELLDFIRYLLVKAERQEARESSSLSISLALRDMEDEEPVYTANDIKVEFQ